MMNLDDLKQIFSDAYFTRVFEDEIARLSSEGRTPGLVHLSHGSEVADAVLKRYLTNENDRITGSHRSHSLALVGGVHPTALAAEIMGLSGGTSDGLGGTQHILSKDTIFLSSNGIVGAQVPIALGAALTSKQLKTGAIAVAAFGEGASNQGSVFESLNLATTLALPVMFLMQNNQMAQSTHVKDSTASNLTARARSFGMVAESVDGTDVVALDTSFARLTKYIRDTGSPAFLEVMVPRLSGHYYGDGTNTDAAKETDPIEILTKLMMAQGADIAEIEKDKARIKQAVSKAIDDACGQTDISADLIRTYMRSNPHLLGDV
ncbi:thiamine pyrophosphate-dependent dehydrogenase E1 component subunit alpha [Kordiimonas sp. SCSIO 12610]|uniref:thiamine pyrophosphate-dependent dehydrogenase E1 component subunit alpha n=1 Tax=Kordiimonas sp. SCSIO 12610 TaxID=2829597 RepID=UPI002108D766|nr:thiamine pyrophosphate-dependent dehydrogenase E1 component subunit alpha [Kordiimonas sp. SCSIO 12610]UTW55326.1 thiamine pyrophosphate-dependent dehydrogenase E1 component subunit alpha [Kordiimonas sp. SCSIO 12610]